MHYVLLALTISAAFLATSAPASPPPTDLEQAQFKESLFRGKLIYEYDRAAWHTTDSMLARLPRVRFDEVKGWVVTPAPHGRKATYYGLDGGGPYVVYSAVWNGSKIIEEAVSETMERRPLSAEEEILVDALNAARPAATKFNRCGSNPFNVVVLPRLSANDVVSVYFLTPQIEAGEYPLGGHYRVDVKDGRIVSQRPFAKSCIALPAGEDDKQPTAAFITHLLDATPTEIHVFGVLTLGKPLYVGTENTLFVLTASEGEPTIGILERR